jgi:predicted double-glycine peptidase
MKKLLAVLCLCSVILCEEKPGVWLDVPFFKQEKDGCGAAGIAMVMQYWLGQQKNTSAAAAAAADPVVIQHALYSKQGHGIYASDLERYFQEHGFRVFSFHGTWEDLKHHLEQGRPLIVALKPTELNAELHYSVVTGLDWEQSIVLLNDPAVRKLLKQDRASFEKQWSNAGRWTLLAVPQQGRTE